MSHNCGQKHATIITDNFRNINDNSMNQSMDARLHRLPRGVFRRFDLSAVWKKQGKQAFFKSQDCNYLQKLQSYSVQVCNTMIITVNFRFFYICNYHGSPLSLLLRINIQPLTFNELCKIPVFCNQFFVGTFFRNLSAIEIDDPVSVLNRGKAMGDDDSRAFQRVDGLGHLFV